MNVSWFMARCRETYKEEFPNPIIPLIAIILDGKISNLSRSHVRNIEILRLGWFRDQKSFYGVVSIVYCLFQ